MRRPVIWMDTDEWKAKSAKDEEIAEGYALRKICDDLQIKAVDEAERTLRFVVSTASPDRDKDTVAVNGWNLESFRRSPVIPFAHDYRNLPVAKAIEIGPQKEGLVSTAQFASKELYPFADTVYQMLLQGFLSAVSVGFRPMKHEVNKERGGIDFLQQELLEYSVVPVPANPEALIQARSAGIDVAPLKFWAEEVLDEFHGESMICVPKGSLEQMVKSLSPTTVTVGELDTPLKSAAEIATDKKETEFPAKAMAEEIGIIEDGDITTGAILSETAINDGLDEAQKLVDATGKEIQQKVDPVALQQALPESYEWITQQLMADVTGFLTRNGIEFRPELDAVFPISTFADSLVVCVLGRDRPYSDDPCFRGAYKRDRRLGGMPRFKGEPEKVDIQVSVDLVQAAQQLNANLENFKFATGGVISDAKKSVEVTIHDERAKGALIAKGPDIKGSEPAVLDFVAGEIDMKDMQECLSAVIVKTMKQEVRERVGETMRAMRGRVD